MEEDKRKQKLKAGKEKLAAFQKKKAKKKKHSDDVDGTDVKSSGDTDVSSSSDVPYSDSDEIAVSGDEFPKDDGRMLLKMRKSLLTATERITELEELLQGKQLALDTVVEENAKLKSSSQLASNQNVEEAIKKRDEIIQQISAHIKATDGASQASYAVATETMVQEVQQLQKQLLEAGNMLRAQGEKHAESSKILQETRTEVLILQQNLADKEAVQTKMEDELRQLTQERDHWKSINEEHRAKEGLINQRLDNGTEFVEKENVVKLENATSLEIEIEHLRKELNESKKREQETGEVVKKLMQHAEEVQKQGGKSTHPDMISVSEMTAKVEHVTAELDEKYGLQIAQMKDQLIQHYQSESDRINTELSQRNAEYENLLVQYRESESIQKSLQLELEQFIHSDSDRTEEIRYLQSKCEELSKHIDAVSASESELKSEKEQLHLTVSSLQEKLCGLEKEKEEKGRLETQLCELNEERQLLLRRIESNEDKVLELENTRDENDKLKLLLTESENKLKTIEMERESDIEKLNEFEELKIQNSELAATTERCSGEIVNYEQQNLLLQKEKEKMALELDQMNEEFEQMAQKAHDHEARAKEVEELMAQLSTLQQERQGLRMQNDELKNKINLQQDSVISQKCRLEEITNEYVALREKVTHMEQENTAVKDDLTGNLEKIQQNLETMSKENSDLRSELENVKAENESTIKELKELLDSTRQEHTKLQSELALKEEQILKEETERMNLRAIMEAQLETKENKCKELEMRLIEKESESLQLPSVAEVGFQEMITSSHAQTVSQEMPSVDSYNDSSMSNVNMEEILEQVILQEVVPPQNSSVSMETSSDSNYYAAGQIESETQGATEVKPVVIADDDKLTVKTENLLASKEDVDTFKSQLDSLNESLGLAAEKEESYITQLSDLQQQILVLNSEKEKLTNEKSELSENSFVVKTEIETLRENIKDLESDRMLLVNKLDKVLLERDKLVEALKESGRSDAEPKFDDSLDDASDGSRDVPKCSSLNDSLEEGVDEPNHVTPDVSRVLDENAVRGNSEMVRNCMPTLEGQLFSSERSSVNVGELGASALYIPNTSHNVLETCAHVQTESDPNICQIDQPGVSQNVEIESNAKDNSQEVLRKVNSLRSQIKQLEENLQSNAVERTEILQTMEDVSSLCERLRKENEMVTEERNKLKKDHDIFKESVCSLRDELDMVQENLEETQGHLHSSTVKYDEVKSNYERLQDHYDVMGDENHSLRIDYDEMQGRYDAIVLENESLAKSVKDSEILSTKIFNESEELMVRLNELEHANTDLTNLKEKYQMLEQEHESLKSEDFEMRENLDQLEKLSEEKQKRLENLEEEVCKVSAKQQESWDQVDKLTKTNKILQEDLTCKTEEIETLSVKFQDSQKRIESLEEEKASNFEKLKILEKKMNEKDKLRTENENVRSQLQMLTMELNEKKNENSRLCDQNKGLEDINDQQRQKLEDKILHLVSENSKLLKQIESDRDQLQQSQDLVVELRQNLDNNQQDRREMQENIDSLNIQVEEFLRMRNDLDEKMKTKEQSFAQERAVLEDRIESLNIQAEEFMRMRQDLEEKLNKASADEKDDDNIEDEASVKERLSNFEEVLEQKEKALTDLLERVKIMEEENVELRNENTEYEEKVENLERKLQYATDRLSERSEIIDELSAENESLKNSNATLHESRNSEIEAIQHSLMEKMKELEDLKVELGSEMESRMQEKSQNIGQLKKDIEELKSHISDTEARKEEKIDEEMVVPLSKLQENLSKITKEMGQACLSNEAIETSDVEIKTASDVPQTVEVIKEDFVKTENNVEETCAPTDQNVMLKVKNIELKKENERLHEKIHELELDRNQLLAQVKRSMASMNSENEEQTEAVLEENCRLMDQIEKLNTELSSLKCSIDQPDSEMMSGSLEMEKLHNEVQSLQDENARLLKTINSTENSQTGSDSVVNEHLKISELEEQLAKKTAQVEQLTNKVLEMAAQFQHAKSEYKVLAEKVREETEHTKNTTAALLDSVQCNARLHEDVAAMQTEMTSVIDSKTNVEDSLETVKDALTKREAQIGELEKELDTEVILRNEIADRVEELSNQLTESCQEKEDLANQLSICQKENDESTNQLSIIQKRNDELTNELTETQAEKEELTNQITEVLQREEELLDQISKTEKSQENTSQKLRDLMSQLDEKCQVADDYESRLHEANKQLQSKLEELENETTNSESLYNEMLSSDLQYQTEIDQLSEKMQSIDEKCKKLESEKEDLATENEKLWTKIEEREHYIQVLSKTGEDGEDGSEPGELQQLTLTVCKRETEIQELRKKNKVLEEENDMLKKLKDNFEKVKSERDELLNVHGALSDDLNEMRAKYETVRSLMDDTKKECNKEIEKLREQLSTVNIDVLGLRDTLVSLESEMTQTMDQKAQLMEALEVEKNRRQDEAAQQQESKDVSDKLNKDLQNQRKANESLLSLTSENTSDATSSFVSATDNVKEMSFMVLTFDASTQTKFDPESEQHSISQIMTEYESRVSELSGEVDLLKSEYDELKLKHESETVELQKRIDRIKTTGRMFDVENEGDSVVENFEETNTLESNEMNDEVPDATQMSHADNGTDASANQTQCDAIVCEEECQTDVTMETCEVVDKSKVESIIEQRCKTKLSQLEYELEEKYAFELRNKQVELMDQCEKEKKEYMKEMDQTLKRKIQAIQAEKHKEFVQALQKMKKDFQKQQKGRKLKGKEGQIKEEKESSDDGKAVGQQGNVVSRLKKENQVLAEARDEMMRQIDQLQKEKRVLMGESDDEQDDMIPAGFFLHHDQSGDLDSLLTPSSPFDIGDVFSEEFTCPREDCQLLHQRYMEMQDRVQNIGFEPMGSFEQNASFELHQAGRAQGFEPEIMDTPVESDEAFELRQSGRAQGFEPEIMDTPVESEEAFELCQSGRAQGFEPEIMDTPVESDEAFELRQSGRAQGFEPEIMDTPVESEEAFVREAVQRAEADRILKHPEFRFQSSRDDEVVAEMKLDKRKDLNEDFNNGMEVREHFIAENDQPETAVSHFTPENSSSEEEVFLVEGFISSEVASRTEMEVDSIETPYTLAGRSLSLPSIHAGGDASVKPAEEPSKMQTYAKHFVQCIEELKSKSVSERESYFMKQSEIQEGLTSRTVDFSLGVEKVVKERKGRKRYASQSSPVKTEETNQFLRQYSYEAEDILSVDTGREKEKQIDLLPLESKVSCLEFQISFLEQKINNLEKDKRDVQIELDNEILQRQHLEEEIENLNIDVSQSEAKSGSDRKSRRDRNQSGHHLQSSKDLEAKLDESALTCKYLEKSLSETQAKLEEERRIIMDKEREISDLKGQVHVLSVEKSEVEYHKLRMEENLENIQEEIDPLLTQIKTQQREIEILKLKVPEQTSLYTQHKETQTVENVDIEAKLGESILTSKNLEKSLSETQEKLEEERRIIMDKDREISDLKGQVHVLSVEKSEVEYHKLRMEENLENIQEEIDPLLTQIKIQQREIETLKMRGSERQRSVDTSDQQTQTVENSGETHVKTLKLRSGYDKSEQEEFTSESVDSTHTASSNVLSGDVVEKLKVELTAAEEEIQRLNVQVINKTDEIGELESGVLDLQDSLTLKNAEVHSLCEKMQELEKEIVELKTQKLNRQSSADELEVMKLRGQIFELNEVLVERGNEIVKLENIIAQLNAEVSRLETSDLDTSSESCQYCVDMDKTVKEKDAYIRKLEEHLLGQSMLPSRSVMSSREVTPTQSPRGGAADHQHTASRRGSTPVLSLRNRDDGLSEARRGSMPVVEHGPESPWDGEKTPTETTVPSLFLPQNTNSAHSYVKEGQKVLPRPDKADASTDHSSHISRESDLKSKTNHRKRERPSGRYKGHGPLLPWRSPLDDFSDQSTISAFSSPRLERGDLLDSHFVPELHSSFRSRSPTCSSVSGSVDGSERILSGLGPDQDGHVALENKHFELIDEITQLRRDLRETKSIYTQENALLQEALDREKWMKESMRSKLGMSGTIVNFDLSAELIALRQKVAMLQETNKMLHSENDKWLRKIQDQEQLVLQLREQLGQDLDNFGEVDILFGKQVLMLQKQRNDLLDKIREKDLENNRLSNRIGDMNVIEENLRREKDFLKVKLREKEDVEAELVQRKLEMERLAQNQEKLEEMLYHKDEIERELMKQKRLLEMDLSEIEAKLEEKEGMLEIQKNQLLRELKGSASPSPEPDTVGKSADKRLSVHDDQDPVPSGQSDDRDEEEVCRLHSMLEEAEVQHSRAIQSLKHKYNSERQQTNDTLTEQHGDQRPFGTPEQDHEV